jgi:HK97 family phage major capsid protein
MTTKKVQERLQAIQQRGLVQRAAEVVSIDEENRTVELAFSSETPVQRWWGEETLSHDPAHVRLGRLNDGGALLWNHTWDDQRGVTESARIDSDRKGRALVRFGTSAAAEELWQDVKNRIKRHVSVGYFIHAMQLVEVVEELERWLITDWEPYEISIVSVPADTAVGIGRAADIPAMERPRSGEETPPVPLPRAATIQREHTEHMNTKTLRNAAGDLVRAEVDEDGNVVREIEVIEKAGEGARSHTQRGVDAERTRVREITALAERFGKALPNAAELARAAVTEGKTPTDFQSVLLDAADKRMSQPLGEQTAAADIGMTEREVGEFSLLRVARALADPTSRSAREAAAMEFRASEAAASKAGKSTDNFVIPADVLRRAVGGDFNRDAMSTAVRAALSTSMTGGAGGHLVDTTLMTNSFIDLLRKRTTIMRLGRVMGGLQGNVDIPKKTSGSSGFWVGEGGDVGETGIGLGNILLSPKTVGAYSDLTRRLLMQSSMDAEALVRSDLATALAQMMDLAGYYGTGSANQPLGLANYVGINAVPFVGVNPTNGELIDMETQIALDNADVDSMKYVANASFRGYAKQTAKLGTGTEATIWEPGNSVNGYGCEITNQVAAGDVFMANFQDFIIGLWGSLELNIDKAALALSGGLRLIVFQDCDFVLRRTESVCLGRKAV